MGGAVAEQCCEEWLPCNGPGAWVAVRGPSGVGGKQTQFRPQCSASPTAAGARTDGRGLPPPLGQFLWKEPGFVHRGTGAAAGEQDPLRHLSSSSSLCSPGDLPPLLPMGAACTEGCKASGLPGGVKVALVFPGPRLMVCGWAEEKPQPAPACNNPLLPVLTPGEVLAAALVGDRRRAGETLPLQADPALHALP